MIPHPGLFNVSTRRYEKRDTEKRLSESAIVRNTALCNGMSCLRPNFHRVFVKCRREGQTAKGCSKIGPNQ